MCASLVTSTVRPRQSRTACPRRTERPCSRPYATRFRRTGTLTSFCRNLFHHLDLQVAFRNKLFQSAVLGLELAQTPHILRPQRAEPLAPRVDRLLANPVSLGHLRDRVPIRLADNPHHLLVREPRLPHRSLHPGSQSLTLSMVRILRSRSGPSVAAGRQRANLAACDRRFAGLNDNQAADLSFHEVLRFPHTVFADELHAKRVLSLANATLGLIESAPRRALAVTTKGQALALARPLTKRAIKQVDRLLSNRVSTHAFAKAGYGCLLASGCPMSPGRTRTRP